MKPSLFLLLALLSDPLAAQHVTEVKVPRTPPAAVDPDFKTGSWVRPAKAPAPPGQAILTAAPGSPGERLEQRAAPSPGVPTTHRLAADAVLVDQPGDGKTWVRTRAYKASFAAEGATYIPFFGSRAPKNYPVRFALRSVNVDGRRLAYEDHAEVTTTDRRVTMARGAVTEVYDLMPTGIEQSFVFATLPAGGDLVVRIAVTTELSARQAAEGFEFGNELGHVAYGAAFLKDATGKRTGIESRLEEGAIELRVPAALLVGASFPVTIDPVVSTFSVTTTNIVEYAADVAYDLSQSRYLVVWEEAFSAADHDIGSIMQEHTGVDVAGSFLYLDQTSVSWSHARVANLRPAKSFLMVAARGVAPNRQIWGRIRLAPSNLLSTQFQVSAHDGAGDMLNPDVGGDSHQNGPVYWTAVWERTYTATDSDIHAQQVRSDGSLHNYLIMVDNSNDTHDTHPAISKSNGGQPSNSQAWTVVWQRTYSPGDEDLRYARIHWDGVLTTPATDLDTSNANTTNPAVSSPTDDVGGSRDWLACFEQRITAGNRDVMGVLGRDGSVISRANLTTLENGSAGRDQANPHVDSDGCRFAVIYSELIHASNSDWDTMASTFHVAHGTALGVSDRRAQLGFLGYPEERPRITATRTGPGVVRYAGVWDRTPSATQFDVDVYGAIYDGGFGGGGLFPNPTGCNGLGMTATGLPTLGGQVTFTMTGSGANAPIMMFGLPIIPVTMCSSCFLAVNQSSATFIAGTMLSVPIPRDGAFVGAKVAVQGFTVGFGPCLGQVALSDTIGMTVQ